MYETIFSPVNYGGLELKNRIIFAPTTFGLSDEEYLAEMERLAKGGCAMIIIGDVPVAKSQFEKSLFDKKGFAFYQQICETAHKYGCKVCAQLHQTDTDMMSIIKCIPGMLMKKITPDQLRERMNDAVGPYITKMSQKKIHQIIAGFGKAAVLAKQAGFDMVQVHGDRMCGSFSSANPALDIISIGPDILDIHSPRETLVLDTVYGCDTLIRAILKEIADKKA